MQKIQDWRYIGLLLVCIVAFSAGGYAQDGKTAMVGFYPGKGPTGEINKTTSAKLKTIVALKKGPQKLVQALQSIARQAGLKLSYSKQVIPFAKKITIKKEKLTAEQALWDVLEGTGYRFGISVSGQLVLVKMQTPSPSFQQETITGTVTDSQSGETLPGVNILVKGTSTGTSTDENGTYELTVESLQDTLVFSYVGYQTRQVPINGRTAINVSLKIQAISGQEMVVVGYSEQKKRNIIGSVSNIESEEIERSAETNITQSLEGKMPGLVVNNRGGEPGDNDANILIRGRSTLGNSSPLIVVDGIPRKSFPHLSSGDIASISVLKDASAAIYGARGANGVILIKTKRGEKGKTTIHYEGSSSIQGFTRIPDMMNSYQYAKYENEVSDRYGEEKQWTKKEVQKLKNGTEPRKYPNTDFYGQTFKNWAPQTHQNISASGGSKDVQYYLSGDYLLQKGLYKSGNLNYKQYQIHSNIDAQVVKYLNIGFDLSGRLRKKHGPPEGAGYIFQKTQRSRPTQIAYYPNGLPGIGGENGQNPVIISSDKAGWKEMNNRSVYSKLSFDLNMDWLTKGLGLKGYGSFDFSVRNPKTFHNTWTVYNYNSSTDKYVPKPGYDQNVGNVKTLDQENRNMQDILYNIQLTYKKTFGSHNIDGFVAYEQDERHSDNLSGFRRDVLTAQKPYLYGASPDKQTTNGTASNGGRVSYFGTLNYNYKEKYLINFTFRHDGSFNFPKGKRYGNFPSGSVGWIVSDEPFMTGISNWLDNLKIRSSYGILGNDRVPSFQYLPKYAIGSEGAYYIFGEDPKRYNGFSQSNTPNPNITWETAKKLDIGFDAGLFNEKVTINFDYFYNRRRNILIRRNASIPVFTGLSLPQENLGKMNNKGVEVQASYQNNAKNWGYSIGGNFAYNKNRIVYMDEAKKVPKYKKKEGHPMDSWLVYKSDGIFHNQQEIDNTEATLDGTEPGDIKYVDINGDGKIDGDDQYRKYTSPIPEMQFGLNLGVHYKGFELHAFLQGQAKAETMISFGDLGNRPEYLYTKRWTKDNKDAELPRAYERNDTYDNRTSDFWLYDASFLRVKNLEIAYNVQAKWLTDNDVRNIRIYLKGHNLVTFDHIKHFDPEMDNAEGRYYPQQTLITAGLSINL